MIFLKVLSCAGTIIFYLFHLRENRIDLDQRPHYCLPVYHTLLFSQDILYGHINNKKQSRKKNPVGLKAFFV